MQPLSSRGGGQSVLLHIYVGPIPLFAHLSGPHNMDPPLSRTPKFSTHLSGLDCWINYTLVLDGENLSVANQWGRLTIYTSCYRI